MLWTVTAVLALLLGVMAYMIYMLIRERENSFKWQAALERAIYEAGWIEEYKRACKAVAPSHTKPKLTAVAGKQR